MAMPTPPDDLHRLLWWFPHVIPDPGPWLEQLEQAARDQLIVNELELQRAILQAHLSAAEKRLEILKGIAARP